MQRSRRDSPGRKLRDLLQHPEPCFLIEAHNALSAVIVEESGGAGIWGSSLTLSCSWGVRDENVLSMTQVLEVLESMTDRVEIPILFDGDSGYGSFNRFQRLVQRLGRCGVAGVCIEDKLFPKRNSFLDPESQALAPAQEFCALIRAGKNAQRDDDFVLVARTEALVTGQGLEVALDRAHRYVEAGADAILVHSKSTTFAEVAEFARRWDAPVPLVCIPTTYFGTPPEAFAAANISLVIWANHLLRAGIRAMQQATSELVSRSTARSLEDRLVPLREVFRLQSSRALPDAEAQYLAAGSTAAVILAASRGAELGDLTEERPKCMLPLGGRPLLDRLLEQLRAEGVRRISVVRGYRPDVVRPEGVTLYCNPRWEESGELDSLACATPALEGAVLVAYGDVLFKRYILRELLASDAPLTIAVDASYRQRGSRSRADRVETSAPPSLRYDEEPRWLVEVREDLDDERTHGEWLGLLFARPEGTRLIRQALPEVLAAAGPDRSMSALLNHLVDRHGARIRVLFVWGDWIDVDEIADLASAVEV
ncbi:MAG TPA: phosphoenolpyruvate mutase [Longimicrobiaceae bacterium]|nr:phosphoenolpyruvate mutase [Longimicrobiaceae bacterium]